METTDETTRPNELWITLEALGWKALLQTRRGTSKILVLKSVVRGLCLERGMPVHSYVGRDPAGRPVMLSYLDGKPRIAATGEQGEALHP
ncbi:hypothetical protein HYX09_05470 [Candidatus Woesearchaeota archaeon]|nr:hypothetical protein [Candidatus Woesearchaeota archaeon]